MNFKEADGDPLQHAGTWAGERVVVIATGPSLHGDDLDMAAEHQRRGNVRLIGVNDAYMFLPNDCFSILYAADPPWWKLHDGVPLFQARKIVQNRNGGRQVAKQFGLECVTCRDGEKPSTDPAWIASGWHSGFQAVNIAALMGSRDIILLGFDCQKGLSGKSHYFGEHPASIARASPYPLFAASWDKAAPHYEAAGVKITNSTRRTAIKSLPRRRLEGALNAN